MPPLPPHLQGDSTVKLVGIMDVPLLAAVPAVPAVRHATPPGPAHPQQRLRDSCSAGDAQLLAVAETEAELMRCLQQAQLGGASRAAASGVSAKRSVLGHLRQLERTASLDSPAKRTRLLAPAAGPGNAMRKTSAFAAFAQHLQQEYAGAGEGGCQLAGASSAPLPSTLEGPALGSAGMLLAPPQLTTGASGSCCGTSASLPTASSGGSEPGPAAFLHPCCGSQQLSAVSVLPYQQQQQQHQLPDIQRTLAIRAERAYPCHAVSIDLTAGTGLEQQYHGHLPHARASSGGQGEQGGALAVLLRLASSLGLKRKDTTHLY